MTFLGVVIFGIAAGFLATKILRVNTDVLTTIAIGVGGALIGALILRLVSWLVGMAAGFVGAVLGALVLVWLYKKYMA